MPVIDFFLNDLGGQTTKNLRFDVGATLPVLRVRVMDGNDPVDLAGGTATFTMRDKDGNAKILDAAAIVEGDGSSGIVRYEWDVVDTNTSRIYFGQFTITLAGDDLIVPNDADQVLRIVIGKAEFLRGAVIENPSQGIQIVALGGTPTLDATSRLFKVVVTEADFTAAAAEESIDLFQLPAGAIIQAVKVKHGVAFSGGALSAYTLGVGIAALPQKYLTDFDVFSAPSATNDKVATSGDEESHDAATAIKITAKSTGGDVADATTGSAEVWVVAVNTLSSGSAITASGLELQKDGAGVLGGPFQTIDFVDFLDVLKVSDGIARVKAFLDMIGATSSVDGRRGLVPTPLAGEEGLFLRGDGAWSAAGNSPADDVTIEDTGSILRVKDNGISDARLRDSAGVSIIGRAANSAGDPADIIASVNDRLLGRQTDALGFFQVATAMLADDAVTDTKLEVPHKEIRVVKSSNQSKFNDTLANDSELLLTLGAGETWEVEFGFFVLAASTSPGFKYGIMYSGTEFAFKTVSLDYGEGAQSFNDDSQNGIDGTFGITRNYSISSAVGGEKFIQVKGSIITNTGGTVNVQWAQNSTDGSNATTMQQGSYIMARRLI